MPTSSLRLRLTPNPSLKAKVLTTVGATVTAENGLTVTKENGVYTVSPDFDSLALHETLDSPENKQFWVHDTTSGDYWRVPVQAVVDLTDDAAVSAAASAAAAAADASDASDYADAAAISAASAAAAAGANYDNRDDAEAADIPVALTYIRTAGRTEAGDGEGALYKKVVSVNPYKEHFTDAGGKIWENAGDRLLPVLPTSKSGIPFAQIFESSMSTADLAAVRAAGSYQVIWGGRLPAGDGVFNSGYIPGQRDPDATHNIVLDQTTNLATTPIWTGSGAPSVAWWAVRYAWILFRTITSPFKPALDFPHPGNEQVPLDTRNMDVREYLYNYAKASLSPGYVAIGLDNLTPVNLRGSGQKRGVNLNGTGGTMTTIYNQNIYNETYVEDQLDYYQDMADRAHADGLLLYGNLGRTYNLPFTLTASGSSGGFTLTLASTSGIQEGMDVSGTNIGVGSIVVSIDSGTQITLDLALTGNISSGTITFVQPSAMGTRAGRDIYINAAKKFDLILVERGGASTGGQTVYGYTDQEWEVRHQNNRALALLGIGVVTVDWTPTINSYQYFSGDGAEDTFTVDGFYVIDPLRMYVFVGPNLGADSGSWSGYTPVDVTWSGQSFTFDPGDIPPSATDNILVVIDNQTGLDALIGAGDPTNDYAHEIAASWEEEVSPGVVSPIAKAYEYALGSWLLARGENSFWSFAPINGAHDSVVDGVYWDLIAARVQIGSYLNDPYREGFIWVRDYSNGIVLVNPTSDKDQVFRLPPGFAYVDLRGNAYEDDITLEAATAAVLTLVNN